MAKKRAINRGYRPIRNASMIGRGGKHIKPVDKSWVKGYSHIMAKPKVKSAPAKAPLKSKTGFVPKKTATHNKTVKTVKATPAPAVAQVNRKLNRVARQPVPKVTMKSRKPARKPPTRGR